MVYVIPFLHISHNFPLASISYKTHLSDGLVQDASDIHFHSQ